MISRFTFTRGSQKFEVLVKESWNSKTLGNAKLVEKNSKPIFLEEDDFKKGEDVFALDFFLMKNDFHLIEGEDLISKRKVNKKHLRYSLELEIRKLLAKTRSAYFFRSEIPARDIIITLDGIFLGLDFLFPKKAKLRREDIGEISSLKSKFSPRKRLGKLMEILEEIENIID